MRQETFTVKGKVTVLGSDFWAHMLEKYWGNAYILITKLMHRLLFIHKILFSSTCFEPQVLIFRRIQLYICSIRYHMLHVYNCILLKMSNWGSKHVDEKSILWINNNQCIKLVINIQSIHDARSEKYQVIGEMCGIIRGSNGYYRCCDEWILNGTKNVRKVKNVLPYKDIYW